MADAHNNPPRSQGPPPPPPPSSGGEAAGRRPRRRKLVRRNLQARAERIACTDCGGPVDVRNAATAEMVSCPSCGSVLDLESEDHRILAKVLLEKRPPQYLPLGTKGTFKGAAWEVIGRLRLREGIEAWDEHLLYNPKEGYVWLSLENGHWTFFKKLKNKPSVDPRQLLAGAKITTLGETFKVLWRGTARIDYIEGEFPYQATVGQTLTYLDAVSPPLQVSAEWTDREMEWQLGMYVPPERIQQAFGLKRVPAPVGVGACQPFEQSPLRRTIGRMVLAFGLLCLLLGGLALLGGGEEIAVFRVPAERYLHTRDPNGYLSGPIKVTEPGVVKVQVSAPLSDSWIYPELQWCNRLLEPQFAFTNQISYYSGVDGGESWSEGRRRRSSLFVVDQPGTYYLLLSAEAGSGNKGGPRGETLTVAVYQDVVLARYFILAGLAGLGFAGWELIRRRKFETARHGDDDD